MRHAPHSRAGRRSLRGAGRAGRPGAASGCFANTDGGDLIVGVARDRRSVGVPDPEALGRKVEDVAAQRCEPPVTAVPEVLSLDVDAVAKHGVVIHVPKGDPRPYRTASGQYYVRGGARCRPASREELLRLFQPARSLYSDATPVGRASLADLDRDAVEACLDRTCAQRSTAC